MDKLRNQGGSIFSKGYGSVPRLVMRDMDLDVYAKAMYAYLVSFAGAEMIAFPGRATMMKELGIASTDRYYKALKQLTDPAKDYIRISNEKDEKGKFTANIYEIVHMPTPVVKQKEENPEPLQPGQSHPCTTERYTAQRDTVNRNTNINSSKNKQQQQEVVVAANEELANAGSELAIQGSELCTTFEAMTGEKFNKRIMLQLIAEFGYKVVHTYVININRLVKKEELKTTYGALFRVAVKEGYAIPLPPKTKKKREFGPSPVAQKYDR